MDHVLTSHYPALTVRQPWASLIMLGLKDVENRSWTTEHRGRLWVHAGKTWDSGPLPDGMVFDQRPDSVPYGYLLGTVDLIGITDGSESPWAEPGKHHWVLENPRPLTAPLYWRGRLGLWWPVMR